jgi:hypothetical protein
MLEMKKDLFFKYGWRVVIIISGPILLFGNFLPWPCSGDGFYCTALWIRDLNTSWFGLLLAISVVLMPLYLSILPSPYNYAVWCLFWYLIYLLVVAKLNPFYFDSEIGFYTPFIHINTDSIVPPHLIMRLTLLSFWLAIRPRNLQGIWKFITMLTLIILIVSTGFFFMLLLQSFDNPVLGSGSLMIFAGGSLLLAATIFEPRNMITRVHKDE